MIGLSKISTSGNGAAQVITGEKYGSTIRSGVARVQRDATLDGGTYTSNYGYTDEDRELAIVAQVDQTAENNIWYLFTEETKVNLSTKNGFYSAVIYSCEIDGGQLEMQLYIDENLLG